ncbi:TonB-dependent receptor [Mucilaginibacter robiniae]|uniref:TonB-dependent receptor n=1 Tax=Mucilaginibacter robiniae TaxID=2728022 RepID=A0A7L5DVM0_9SPHI|nr:TonB-dependent receptor [Mucilaginibacter robiniae]QJD94771.1 TonB-dependent receptor [Mucilaginibacter robiniae]
MIKLSTSFFLLFFTANLYAQNRPDTLSTDINHRLLPVTIRGYLSDQPVLRVPASVDVLGVSQLALQPQNSLVSAMNTLPGVRMEERTPGSYRLSIRGSLLRSPFGVRNVKIYYDEIPLTDAGGNTYLNALDVNSLHSLEVLKGPDGSLFGANSGGVVLINPVNRFADSTSASINVNAGSYGLFHENAAVHSRQANNEINLNQGYQTYDGYRDHSYMQRHFIQGADRYHYGTNNQIKLLGFYSDLNYQTPGGLTLSQMQANPRAARPSTAAVPGAIAQNIGIDQKVLFGGVVNEAHLTHRLRNVATIFGTHVDFTNPFITNYEHRVENTYGLRTYFELSSLPHPNLDWKLNLGIEWQQTNANINDYDNLKGLQGNPQSLDRVNTNQHFIFTRYAATLFKSLNLEAALSLNYYQYRFKNNYPLNQTDFTKQHFSPQVMPRIALSYEITPNFIWRASVSRGYSTPTIAEVRPSNNLINTNLQAEYGWNYETGFRLRTPHERLVLDASVFYYRLNNSIVAQYNANETQYFINAGGTNQPGLEASLSYWLVRQKNTGFIRGVQFIEAYTLSRFTFRNYNPLGVNYSGNRLTGVPRQVNVSSLQFKFPQAIYLFVQYNYTDKLPVNDANTAYASSYHLLQAKAGWEYSLNRKTRLNLYAGADNLLNHHYSLGNDLNAIGNRYYNPAPLRNYYVGVSLVL